MASQGTVRPLEPSAGSIPIIHDCDPGHDDAIAMLLAVQSPRIDLRGVTTTFGNCSVDDATRNAMRVLTLARATATPIARGAAGPLTGEGELGNYVHGKSGLDGPNLPEPGVALSALTATELMVEILTSSSQPVTIVATGPITNVARLLRDHPDLKDKIGHVIFMGGSSDRGNHTPTAEFNTYSDPEALAIVLTSGLPISMVGLNLTHQALATPAVVEKMRAMNHQVGRIAADWMGFFGSSYRAIWGFESPPVHDPCTVASLIRPALITWRECFVAVETGGEWTRGTTVVDLHGRYKKPANARVAMELDVEGYWELVLSAIDAFGTDK
jgi:purine nucleosidase/pyrimidine-specific ribonucleoside hydrolase